MIYYDLLYSQTICSDNNAAAECLSHLDMSFCLQFLEGLGDVLEVKRTTKRQMDMSHIATLHKQC
jgi:hypothetical protein